MLSIISELKSSSSANHKKEVLKANQGNKLWLRVLDCTYNPYKNYYIRKLPKPDLTAEHVTLVGALDRIETNLSTRKVTGNAAMDLVAELLGGLNKDDRAVFEMVLKRDLDCGIAASSINKVYGDLIPEYPVLLASTDDPDNRARIKFPAFVELKCDGMRVNAHVTKAGVLYFSRKGKAVECGSPALDDILKEMASHSNSTEMVFDGELLAFYPDGKPMERQIGNGICNKAMTGTISEKERDLLGIVLWDAIPREDFLKKKCALPYHERRAVLARAVREALDSHRVQVVESREVNNWDEAQSFYREKIALGCEGLIIKNRDHIWEDKRSKDLVKMKQCLSGDFLVVGWEPSDEPKYKGQLGALIVQNKDGTIRSNVGSGISDELRKTLTPDNCVGKIVEVEYNAIVSKKGSNQKSLYLPVFVRMRPDKDKPD